MRVIFPKENTRERCVSCLERGKVEGHGKATWQEREAGVLLVGG